MSKLNSLKPSTKVGFIPLTSEGESKDVVITGFSARHFVGDEAVLASELKELKEGDQDYFGVEITTDNRVCSFNLYVTVTPESIKVDQLGFIGEQLGWASRVDDKLVSKHLSVGASEITDLMRVNTYVDTCGYTTEELLRKEVFGKVLKFGRYPKKGSIHISALTQEISVEYIKNPSFDMATYVAQMAALKAAQEKIEAIKAVFNKEVQ